MDPLEIAKKASEAAQEMTSVSTDKKNSAILKMADLLEENVEELNEANEKDLQNGKEKGLPENLINRLVFDKEKIKAKADSLRMMASLPDPVGQYTEMEKRPNGLMVGRMRVPLGVILMIYEARPHVTVNGGAFALKSGNVIILKGGKEAIVSNDLIGELWKKALKHAGLPEAAVQCLRLSHEDIAKLLQMTEYINLVIPRGGKKLIESVNSQSKIPVIKHFAGICHVYVDDNADIEKAIPIILNSKLLMPEVCNAAETLLISEKNSKEDIKRIIEALRKKSVEVCGDKAVRDIVSDIIEATDEDWITEYLDKKISVKIVKGIGDAVSHINKYGSAHTDTIVTNNYAHANEFTTNVDSGVVLVNASTMFDDGEELGMGAEIGISTDKIHARGPMGLKELTSYKFVVFGEGQIKGG